MSGKGYDRLHFAIRHCIGQNHNVQFFIWRGSQNLCQTINDESLFVPCCNVVVEGTPSFTRMQFLYFYMATSHML